MFDFFFQTIWDILSVERLARMEQLSLYGDSDPLCDRNRYEYVASSLLRRTLASLASVRPPKLGEQFSVQVNVSIPTRHWLRALPPSIDIEEHHLNFAQWALPVIFEWIPPDIIIWALGLLVCEAKLLVVGNEPGIVSSVIMGLLALMHPLKWVAPLIPILPIKHIDFIESPVPIVAGIILRQSARGCSMVPASLNVSTVEGSQHTDGGEDIADLVNFDPIDLLSRVNDAAYGSVCAVLDLSRRDLYVQSSEGDKLKEFAMCGANNLSGNNVSSMSIYITPLYRRDKHQRGHTPTLGMIITRSRCR